MSSIISNYPKRFPFAKHRRVSLPVTLIIFMLVPAAAAEPPQSSNAVLAYVGEESITTVDVDFQLGRNLDAQVEQQSLSPVLQGTTVHLLGLQRQALETLREMGLAVTNEQVEQWLQAHPIPASQRERLGDAKVRGFVTFRLSWQNYLATQLNAKNVKRHFEQQKPRFDGTQFTLCMASVEVPPGKCRERQAAVERLIEVRDAVLSANDPLSHVLLARKDIERLELNQVTGTESLNPTAVDVLLKLKPGELSKPFHSAVGVHLLQLLDATPGHRELNEVTAEVRAHMLIFLLEHLASKSSAALPLTQAQPIPHGVVGD